jgi:chromosome segregation ATPase
MERYIGYFCWWDKDDAGEEILILQKDTIAEAQKRHIPIEPHPQTLRLIAAEAEVSELKWKCIGWIDAARKHREDARFIGEELITKKDAILKYRNDINTHWAERAKLKAEVERLQKVVTDVEFEADDLRTKVEAVREQLNGVDAIDSAYVFAQRLIYILNKPDAKTEGE